MALAYGVMIAASGLRWAGGTWADTSAPLIISAGALWVVAFVLFVIGLWPAFSQPRQ